MKWLFRRLGRVWGNEVAVDLGTALTLVYVKGSGIALKEPSVVAVDETDGRPLAVGGEAKRMLGKTPVGILAKRPMKDGVITDFDLVQDMLYTFLTRVLRKNFLVRPIRPSTLLALLAGEIDQPAAPAQAAPRAVTEPAPGTSWRVLVAEDNEINALLTRTVVTRLGCVPVVVPNGREAIDEVARSLAGKAPRVDAILMDLHMPVVDGLAATAEIHRICDDAGEPRPAIIAVTANAFQEDRDRCLAAGMDNYLSKPFEPGDLRRILEGISVDPCD